MAEKMMEKGLHKKERQRIKEKNREDEINRKAQLEERRRLMEDKKRKEDEELNRRLDERLAAEEREQQQDQQENDVELEREYADRERARELEMEREIAREIEREREIIEDQELTVGQVLMETNDYTPTVPKTAVNTTPNLPPPLIPSYTLPPLVNVDVRSDSNVNRIIDRNVADNLRVRNDPPIFITPTNVEPDSVKLVKTLGQECFEKEKLPICLFDHSYNSPFHSSKQPKASNFLPGWCQDHQTSILGLMETTEVVKKFNETTCEWQEHEKCYLVAKKLETDERNNHAFYNDDIIYPMFNRGEMIAMLQNDGVNLRMPERFNASKMNLSRNLRNAFVYMQPEEFRVVNICQDVDKIPQQCNIGKMDFIAALFVLLTKPVFTFQITDKMLFLNERDINILGFPAAILVHKKILQLGSIINGLSSQYGSAFSCDDFDCVKSDVINFLPFKGFEHAYPNKKASGPTNITINRMNLVAIRPICDEEKLIIKFKYDDFFTDEERRVLIRTGVSVYDADETKSALSESRAKKAEKIFKKIDILKRNDAHVKPYKPPLPTSFCDDYDLKPLSMTGIKLDRTPLQTLSNCRIYMGSSKI